MSKKGFTYLEVIIGTGIVLIISHAFFTLISTSYQFIGLSRTQTSARSLAVQQLELIRNMPYQEIGTVNGIPAGLILQVENRNLNGQIYTTRTRITYVDSPIDNLSPQDQVPTDFKRVKVQVTWEGPFSRPEGIELFTDISPPYQETITSGGTIIINVFDANGVPVSQADVQITATSTNPMIDLNLFTDNNGIIQLPGSPPCTACYNIIVTKTGYSQDSTYQTSQVSNPSKPPLTVINNQISAISFSIDQLATLNINSYNASNPSTPSPNSQFILTGSKSIGFNELGELVPKYSQTLTTNSSGQLSIDLEWDSYQITDSNNLISGASDSLPLVLQPQSNQDLKYSYSPQTNFSLFAQVEDASSSAIPLADVLITGPSSFSSTLQTGDINTPNFGDFFTNLPISGEYAISVTHPNFQSFNTTIDIQGNEQTTIILNSN